MRYTKITEPNLRPNPTQSFLLKSAAGDYIAGDQARNSSSVGNNQSYEEQLLNLGSESETPVGYSHDSVFKLY